MFPFKVVRTWREVEQPSDCWCENGHIAPKEFKREGPDAEPEPTKFFHINGDGFNKTICEPCLIVINYLVQQKKKKGKADGI